MSDIHPYGVLVTILALGVGWKIGGKMLRGRQLVAADKAIKKIFAAVQEYWGTLPAKERDRRMKKMDELLDRLATTKVSARSSGRSVVGNAPALGAGKT